MKIKIVLCSLALIFSGILIMSSSVFARMACDPDCLADAKTTFKGCVAACKEDFQIAKDGCRNIDHICAEGCRESFESCIEPVHTDLAECKAPCNATLAEAIAICREKNAKGSPGRDVCIDIAQLASFLCKDTCREAANPLLKLCRDDFKACMITCKLPPPPAP